MPLSKKLKIFLMRKSEVKSHFQKVNKGIMTAGKGIGLKSNSVLSLTTEPNPITKVSKSKTQLAAKLLLATGRLTNTFFSHIKNVLKIRLRLQLVRNAKILS